MRRAILYRSVPDTWVFSYRPIPGGIEMVKFAKLAPFAREYAKAYARPDDSRFSVFHRCESRLGNEPT